jgi:DNA-binding Xre family transcriptional regulator
MRVIGVDEIRQLLIDYLHDNKVSLNQVSREAGIHQPNLHVFINSKEKGLSAINMEKLYKVIGTKQQKRVKKPT